MPQKIKGKASWPDNWALVNVAVRQRKYFEMQKRLIKSVENFGASLYMWMDYPAGAKSHVESPYGFKVHAIRAAINLGAQVIVWVDSAVWVIRDPSPFFKLVEQEGIVFLAGLSPPPSLAQFVNDSTLREFGYEREGIKNISLTVGAVFGFNFADEKALKFFEEFERYEGEGWFFDSDPWSPKFEHRMDEALARMLLLRHGIEPFSHSEYYRGEGQGDGPNVMFIDSKRGY